jgi:hypothetical protein
MESKKTYISKFDEFVSKTSSNCKDFTEKDWAEADSTFAHLENDDLKKWKNELTPDESKHINELKGKYYALKVKDGLIDLKNGLKDLEEQGESFVKELGLDSTLNK